MTWNDTVIAEFRAGAPRVADTFDLPTLLLLHTTGARSGQPRVAPLAFLTINGTIVVVASAAGAPKNPDWYVNLLAHPQVTVERWVDGELVSRPMTAVPAQDAERDRLWERIVRMAPAFGEYQGKTTRTIPVVRLEP